MIVLSTQKVMQLHQFLMQETGGLDGIRDEGLFDSAVQGPFATFGGQEPVSYTHLANSGPQPASSKLSSRA